jgi:restriction endonuclease S subunit
MYVVFFKVNTTFAITKFIFFVFHFVAKMYVNTGMGNPKLKSNVVKKIIITVNTFPIQKEKYEY